MLRVLRRGYCGEEEEKLENNKGTEEKTCWKTVRKTKQTENIVDSIKHTSE